MKIRTRQIDESIITKQEIKEAIEFYLSKLLPKHNKKDIEINVSMKSLEEKGYILWLDKTNRPKKYKIVLNNNFKKKQTLLTLAHECVHLKQYLIGEMVDYTKTITKWRKEPIDSDVIDYFDSPWEIEAYGREWGLYCRYVQSRPPEWSAHMPHTLAKKEKAPRPTP